MGCVSKVRSVVRVSLMFASQRLGVSVKLGVSSVCR